MYCKDFVIFCCCPPCVIFCSPLDFPSSAEVLGSGRWLGHGVQERHPRCHHVPNEKKPPNKWTQSLVLLHHLYLAAKDQNNVVLDTALKSQLTLLIEARVKCFWKREKIFCARKFKLFYGLAWLRHDWPWNADISKNAKVRIDAKGFWLELPKEMQCDII